MSETARSNETRLHPHFFRREPDGSVKLRMKFSAEEATLLEEAAGSTPLLPYMHRSLVENAKRHIRAAKAAARR